MPLNFHPSTPDRPNSSSPKPTQRDTPKIDFPVSQPKYKLKDLIVEQRVSDELDTIIKSKECWDKVFVEWNLKSVLKDRKNLFVNLYGAPGTGKTMAAHAIADALGKEIICVNYADIESKYVGETSKNLTNLFSFAKSKGYVIFFDEADALLSKRVTNMSNSTDVSVNQTRSVLLTLLNDYEGMVIFASNFISNYDPAFMRRIHYHVYFPLPNKELRERLWRMYIPSEMPTNIDYTAISKEYEGITGSDISNAVLKAALCAAKNGDLLIKHEFFVKAIEEIVYAKKANSNSSDLTVSRKKIDESDVPEDIRIRETNDFHEVK